VFADQFLHQHSLKLIRSLKRDKDKLKAEVAALQEEIQGLNNKGQP